MLVVEDGTGLSNAESYLSVADADAYWTDHGDPTEWSALTEPQKESALRYATAWLDGQYTFIGQIQIQTQALEWPRGAQTDADGRWVDANQVPRQVRAATAELAKQHTAQPLGSATAKQTIREKLGPMEVEYEENQSTALAQLPIVDQLLGSLLLSGGSANVGRVWRG